MKHIPCFAFGILALSLVGCGGNNLGVAITGLETITYVNNKLTFNIAVTGGTAETLHLLRNGEVFQIVSGGSFTWDTQNTPEGTYTFVARAQSGGKTVDSSARLVVVDRTPANLTFNALQSATPLVLPGSIALSATANDSNGIPKVEFLNGNTKLGEASTAPYTLDLPLAAADKGIYNLVAQVVDRAGNIARSPIKQIPAYIRQTTTLNSEATLDGCIDNGYTGIARTYTFTNASCAFNTSYDILHFFSFNRSGYPNAVIENATFRFNQQNIAQVSIKLASVNYNSAASAPPTTQSYPYTSNEPETTLPLTPAGSPPAAQQRFDVTNLVQSDTTAGRSRSQFRLRSASNGPGDFGGTVYFAEAATNQTPTLELTMLVP